jgi:WD40 repeat protein
VQHLADHVQDAGPDAWQGLAARPAVLDRLDPAAVSAAALPRLIAGDVLPGPVVAVVCARHRLSALSPRMRPVTGRIAMALYSGGGRRTGGSADLESGGPEPAALSVRWSRLDPLPVQIVLDGHTAPVTAVAELPDRDALATADADGNVLLWDRLSLQPTGRPLYLGRPGISALTVLTDQSGTGWLAVGGQDGMIRLMNPANGERGHPVPTGQREGVRDVVAFPGPDRRQWLASLGGDGSVRLWGFDSRSRQLDGIGSLRTGRVTAMAVVAAAADGGALLALGGADGDLELWCPDRTEPLARAEAAHDDRIGAVTALRGMGGRTVLCTVGWDDTVRTWTVPSNGATGAAGATALVPESTSALTDPRLTRLASICALTLPDGRELAAVGGADRVVGVLDPVGTAPEPPVGSPAPPSAGGASAAQLFEGHTDRVARVTALHTGPDLGALLVSGSRDGTVRVWTPHRACGPTAAGRRPGVRALAFHEDGATLASAGLDGSVALWDTATGDRLLGFRAHDCPVGALALWREPDGRSLMATGGDDGTVLIWDLEHGVGRPYRKVAAHSHRVCSLTAFRPAPGDPTRLASGSWDGTAGIWDPAARTPVARLADHSSRVYAVAAFTDPVSGGTLLATGGDDATIRTWSPRGEPVDALVGVSADNLTALPGPDGTARLAAATFRGEIWTWDAKTGQQYRIPHGHSGRPPCLAASGAAGSPLLVSAGADQTLRLHEPVGLRHQVFDVLLPVSCLAARGGRVALGTARGPVLLDLADGVRPGPAGTEG